MCECLQYARWASFSQCILRSRCSQQLKHTNQMHSGWAESVRLWKEMRWLTENLDRPIIKLSAIRQRSDNHLKMISPVFKEQAVQSSTKKIHKECARGYIASAARGWEWNTWVCTYGCKDYCIYKPLCDDSEKVSQVFTLSQDRLRCLWRRKGESVVKIWIGLLLKLTSYEHNCALECSPSNLEVC